MKMKRTMLEHATKMQLSDGRFLPVEKVFFKQPSGPTVVQTGTLTIFDSETVNMAEVVKCWQGDTLLYQRMDFEKETPYCENCDTIDNVCFRPDHYEKGYYTAYGEWECGKCHTQDGLGVLRQCTVCEGEFNSKEGECVCEVCMDKGGIA